VVIIKWKLVQNLDGYWATFKKIDSPIEHLYL